MKILLCAIARLENLYIREWVEYYKNLGVDNICLYDNNGDGEENFNDVIGDFIKDGFIILKNSRNIFSPIQLQKYKECYEEYKNRYDWIMFFDIDEFLELTNGKSMKEHLSDKKFAKYNVVHVNWKVYGDCGMVKNDGRRCLERFIDPLPLDCQLKPSLKENSHVKSIVKGNLHSFRFSTPHAALTEGKCCSFSGKPCVMNSPFNSIDYDDGFLKHFETKTAEEYVKKIKRGYCDVHRLNLNKLFFQFFHFEQENKRKRKNIQRKWLD